MNIDIGANGIAAHKDVDHFVACRADLALGAMRDQVGLVSVSIDDDGEAGTSRCTVLIRPCAHPDIVVEGSDANLYVAVHRTLDAAGWSLARALLHQQNEFIGRQFELTDDPFARSANPGLRSAVRAA